MSDAGQQQTEAQSLRRYLDALKVSKGMSQAQFAAKYQILGGASMISQHLAGTRPINLEQAIRYASGFQSEGVDCSVGLLSPRLAAEVSKAYAMEKYPATAHSQLPLLAMESTNVAPLPRSPTGARWPFTSVTLQEVESLSADQRHIIESLMRELLSGRAAKSKQRTPAKKMARN